MRTRSVESGTFLILVVLITGTFVWIVHEFLLTVFWAVVLAVLFQPIFLRWMGVLRGRRSVAALLTTLTVFLAIFLPLGLLAAEVTRQAIALYRDIASGVIDLNAPIEFIERSTPALIGFLAELGVDVENVRTSLESAAVAASRYIATEALGIGQDMLTFAILFVLVLYLLFFFVRDWERILDAVVRALPLGDARERRLFDRFAEVSRATIKGTLVVAAAQGAIGGLLFLLLGIRAAVLWGVLMAVFSLLPAIGAAIIWVPAAIVLIATGSLWKGIILTAGGIFLIGLADNFLRPILVGHATKLPDYLVLLSTLGGLAVFGIAGLVIGPLVAALFLVVWEMMAEEYPVPPPALRY